MVVMISDDKKELMKMSPYTRDFSHELGDTI